MMILYFDCCLEQVSAITTTMTISVKALIFNREKRKISTNDM